MRRYTAAKYSTLTFARDTMLHMIKSAEKHHRAVAATLYDLRDALTAPTAPERPDQHLSGHLARIDVLRAAVSEMLADSGGATKVGQCRCRLTVSKPVLKAPIMLKLQYIETLSNFAFNSKLCRYTKGLFNRAADFSSTSLKQLAAAERGACAHQLVGPAGIRRHNWA